MIKMVKPLKEIKYEEKNKIQPLRNLIDAGKKNNMHMLNTNTVNTKSNKSIKLTLDDMEKIRISTPGLQVNLFFFEKKFLK